MTTESPVFQFRALEMHGSRMWRPDRLFEALEFASAHQMTALVLHDNTIIHDTIFPKKYFDDSKRKGYAQVRRHQNAIYAKQAYLNDLLKHAKRKNIEVWVEIKELEFPDELLESFPQLTKDGKVCPTDPLWLEYLQVKTDEFFELFPDMAGIIVSPGSPESRAFLSVGGKCSCDRCKAMDFGDWCYGIIMGLYQSVKSHGKKLAVRDFVYSPEDHQRLSGIISRTPEDVIFCIKVTPRDFWPTFPDNPMIGRFKERTQWIEYDVFGQFFGWGVCPAIVLEDIRKRLEYALSQGVSGVMFRTEWENLPELSCFDNLNKINLIGGARMAIDLKYSDEQIIADWLAEEGLISNGPERGGEVNIPELTGFLLKTWPIMKKTIYIDGFVFATCSELPLNIEKAWFTMTFYHSLAAWDPSTASRISMAYDNLLRLLNEKEEALKEIQELLRYLDHNDFGLPEPSYLKLKEGFLHYERYVKCFVLAAGACLIPRSLSTEIEDETQRKDLIGRLENNLNQISKYVAELKAFEESTSYPYYVYLLNNYRNLKGIMEQAQLELDKIRKMN